MEWSLVGVRGKEGSFEVVGRAVWEGFVVFLIYGFLDGVLRRKGLE